MYSKTFLDADRDDIVFVEILASRGYTDEQEQACMAAIAREAEAAAGIKRDDFLLVITEVDGAAWHAPSVRRDSGDVAS